MRLGFVGHLAICTMLVLSARVHAMEAHIYQSCLKALQGVPALNFTTSQARLGRRMQVIEATLALLDKQKVQKMKDAVNELMMSPEASPKFYSQAKKAIRALNEIMGKNNKQYKALEALHNDLLTLVVSAKPSPDSPEMSSFFSIPTRYQVTDPSLRKYIILQILSERKGSKYKGTHALVENDGLIRPSDAWDVLSDLLFIEDTKFSDEEFLIIKDYLQSQEPHEVKNARDLVFSASNDGYFTSKQFVDLIRLAESTKDPTLFRDVVEFANPNHGLQTLLSFYAKDQNHLFWITSLKALNRTGNQKMLAYTVKLVENATVQKSSLGALRALPSPKKLTSDQQEGVQIAWLRHLSNEEIPRSEVFGAVNWLEGAWGDLLGNPLIDKNINKLIDEVDKEATLGKIAVEASIALKNFKLLDTALNAANKADPLVRAQILSTIFTYLEAQEIPRESADKIKLIFKSHAEDSFIQEHLDVLDFLLKKHGL